jgi:hypothetical protein
MSHAGDLQMMPLLLRVSVAVELLIDVGVLIRALVGGDDASVPGAFFRLAVVGLLGVLILTRHSRPACWLFAALEYVTAASCLVFAFIKFPGLQPSFSPVLLAAFVAYLALGVAVTVGGRKLRIGPAIDSR